MITLNLYSIEMQNNIMVFIMANICYVLLIGKAHEIIKLPVLYINIIHGLPIFHHGGLFIKAFS